MCIGNLSFFNYFFLETLQLRRTNTLAVLHAHTPFRRRVRRLVVETDRPSCHLVRCPISPDACWCLVVSESPVNDF